MNILGFEIFRKGFLDQRVAQTVSLFWDRGREVYAPFDFKPLIEMYKSWVYVCASKNSAAVAEVPIKLYVTKTSKSQKLLVQTKSLDWVEEKRLRSHSSLYPYMRKAVEIEEVLEHPLLDLFQKVSDTLNHFDLWFLTELFMELTGNAYWYIPNGPLGVPGEIHILPSQFMRIAINKGGFIGGYVYQRAAQKVPFDLEEVVHFKVTSPSSQLYGQGPLSAVMETVMYDQKIRRFENNLMQNMGRPEAVLETDQPLDSVTYERVKTDWNKNYGGEKKVGKTVILGKGLTYKPITMNAKETGYLAGRKLNKEEIAAAFGVPLSKLQTENVNLANARVGETQYQRDTIAPRLRRIEEKLNESFVPLYDSNLFLAYDDNVEQDIEQTLRVREANLSTGYTVINEERELDNKSPVPWGDKPILSATMVSFDEERKPGSGSGEKPSDEGPLPSENRPSPGETTPDDIEVGKFADSVVKAIEERMSRI